MTLFADASTGSRSPALVHQGRIGEIIQAKPEQRRRVLEEAAGISGLHARRHEAELRLKAAETNLLRVEDVVNQLAGQIDALKRQARQAIRYRNVSAEVRKVEATLYYLRWLGANTEVKDSEQAKDLSVRAVADATIAQSEAGKGREAAAEGVPPLREAEARAAAALQRLLIARDTLDAEETRARDRLAELDRRLAQFEEDVARERTLVADAEAALAQLAQEEETLRHEVRASAERRSGVDARAAEADSVVSAAEKTFGELTGALADLTARRNQLTATAREQSERVARMESEIANIEAGLAAASESRPDLAAHGRRGRKRAGRRWPCRAGGACRRSRAWRRPQEPRRRAHPAGRRRTRGAAPRHRSQDADEASGGRDRKHVAAGDRQDDRREGLRDRAWRRARRRSRRAGRPVPRHALDGRRGRSVRSGAAGRRAALLPSTCRRRRSWRAVSPRSA